MDSHGEKVEEIVKLVLKSIVIDTTVCWLTMHYDMKMSSNNQEIK